MPKKIRVDEVTWNGRNASEIMEILHVEVSIREKDGSLTLFMRTGKVTLPPGAKVWRTVEEEVKPLTPEERIELEQMRREDRNCKLTNHNPGLTFLRRLWELESRALATWGQAASEDYEDYSREDNGGD